MNPLFGRLRSAAPLLALLGLAGILAACQDNTSALGLPYYKDTVSYRSDTLLSPGTMLSFAPLQKSQVSLAGRLYNETWASPVMLVGRVKSGLEDVESWCVLRFRTVTSDTLAKVTAVRLLLQTVAYKYGPDSASSNVDFQVFAQQGGGTISDSSVTINPSELTTSAVGHFTGSLVDSSGTIVAIPIDSAEIQKLIATSYAFVIEPGTSMNHVRGFATSDGAAGTVPLLQYTMRTDTGLVTFTKPAVLDMHVVRDNSTTPAGEIELRGSLGKRAHLDIDITKLADSLELSRFSTINSAVIELHMDLDNSRQSNLAMDTTGPSLIRLTGGSDSSATFYGVMTRDPSRLDVYRITCGNLIELWLRDSSSYHGLELWAGSSSRSFTGSYALVDDNTINRWCFYGPNATDPTKRPRLYVSHSTLK